MISEQEASCLRILFSMLRSAENNGVVHPFPPVFNTKSRILILGSFPSVKSREENFYYGHPSNRFWKVLSSVFNCPIPQSVEYKKKFLLDNGIALWDVILRCDITASSDSSIKNVVPNDISYILDHSCIGRIYLNGKTAAKYYNKYIKDSVSIEAICLPSTSPANASWSMDMLIDSWSVINK